MKLPVFRFIMSLFAVGLGSGGNRPRENTVATSKEELQTAIPVTAFAAEVYIAEQRLAKATGVSREDALAMVGRSRSFFFGNVARYLPSASVLGKRRRPLTTSVRPVHFEAHHPSSASRPTLLAFGSASFSRPGNHDERILFGEEYSCPEKPPRNVYERPRSPYTQRHADGGAHGGWPGLG
jgi:hypothetical protein